MKIENLLKHAAVATGIVIACRGILDVRRAAKADSCDPDAEGQGKECGACRMRCGILKVLMGGMITGIASALYLIDFEGRIEEKNPELAGKLAACEALLEDQLAQQSKRGMEAAAALRDTAVNRWNSWREER